MVMTSQLQQDESGLREVRRILVEWIAAAAAGLARKKVSDKDIHEARKRLKKARAALRLLRDAIGETAYKRDNAALRDTARPLGVARDSRVLIDALDALVDRHRSGARPSRLDKFRRTLRQEQRQSRQALTATLMTRQRRALQAVVKHSQHWRMHGDDWAVIGAGLTRIYRSGRNKFAKAKDSRDSQLLHDWRKQVKYLWHQLQLLRPLRPGKIGALADQCHQLADALGDDHDLEVLRQKIVSHPEAFDRSRDMDELLHGLDRRRVQLQDEAFTRGTKLFADKPRVFARRLGKYWKAWRNTAPA